MTNDQPGDRDRGADRDRAEQVRTPVTHASTRSVTAAIRREEA